MDAEKLKRFIILYLAIYMPAIFLLFAALTGAGILYFLLLFGWIGSGLLLIYLPTAPERNDQ